MNNNNNSFTEEELVRTFVILGRTHEHEVCFKIEQQLRAEYNYTDDDLFKLSELQSYASGECSKLGKTLQALDDEVCITVTLSSEDIYNFIEGRKGEQEQTSNVTD